MKKEFIETYFDSTLNTPNNIDVLKSNAGQYLMNLAPSYLDGYINYFDDIIACYYMTNIDDTLAYSTLVKSAKDVINCSYDDYISDNIDRFQESYKNTKGQIGLKSLGLDILFLLKSDNLYGVAWYDHEKFSCEYGTFYGAHRDDKIISDAEKCLTRMQDNCWLHSFGNLDTSLFNFLIHFN